MARDPAEPLLPTSGPVSTSRSVKSAMMRDRASGGGEFHADLEHARAHMVGSLHSEIASTAIPLPGSATYANEGVIAQLVPPGGKLLIHTNGVYGDRLIEIAAALVHFDGPRGMVGCPSISLAQALPMPHKHNAARRHHIPKMSVKVQNWPAYEAGLRQRGSLTLWIEDGALEDWQTCGQGGQARYADAAIQTSLMLRTAFKLPLRQTEGLMASVLKLMDLTISAPDHTTVSRRAVKLPGIQPAQVPHGALHVLIDSTGLQVYGAGQWLEANHGAKSRRKWRKLHLAVDAASGMIVAQTLTDQDADDPSQVAPLLDQIEDRIARVTADGAYDGDPTYQTIAAHGDDIDVVIPPRSTVVPSGERDQPTQRDHHLKMITERGRLAWQASTGYGQRSLVETTMGRYKALIGARLRARGFAAQRTEAAIGVVVLNRMLAAGHPNSVRLRRVIA